MLPRVYFASLGAEEHLKLNHSSLCFGAWRWTTLLRLLKCAALKCPCSSHVNFCRHAHTGAAYTQKINHSYFKVLLLLQVLTGLGMCKMCWQFSLTPMMCILICLSLPASFAASSNTVKLLRDSIVIFPSMLPLISPAQRHCQLVGIWKTKILINQD